MFNFNFSKAMYKDHELMKLLSIPRATFYKWQQEWISKGLDPKAMGKIILSGTKTSYWHGPTYWEWFWENKVNQGKYDDNDIVDDDVVDWMIVDSWKIADE